MDARTRYHTVLQYVLHTLTIDIMSSYRLPTLPCIVGCEWQFGRVLCRSVYPRTASEHISQTQHELHIALYSYNLLLCLLIDHNINDPIYIHTSWTIQFITERKIVT